MQDHLHVSTVTTTVLLHDQGLVKSKDSESHHREPWIGSINNAEVSAPKPHIAQGSTVIIGLHYCLEKESGRTRHIARETDCLDSRPWEEV